MRRPCRDAAQVGEIDDFSFASASSSPRDTCRPLDRHDPSKHGLFCYPDRRGVRFIAGVAAARDDKRVWTPRLGGLPVNQAEQEQPNLGSGGPSACRTLNGQSAEAVEPGPGREAGRRPSPARVSQLNIPMTMGRRVADGRHTAVRAKTACGVFAAPVFIGAFTLIGARRAGYDWRRHAVSSLGAGREGWAQRANFVVVGALYCVAAGGLAQSHAEVVGPSVVPAITLAAGVGLIGSGVFVTDPVGGFPPSEQGSDGGSRPSAPTRAGKLHNLCAIPIFVGIPIEALVCAGSAGRRRDFRWAACCAASAVGMTGSFVLFGAGFGGVSRLAALAGVFQRISIATGFGWLSALSLRALPASRL